MPPCNVINFPLSGEFIHRLPDTGRYDKVASKLPGLDYILLRYGLNDVARPENSDTSFPKDFHELSARLRKDHPAATIIPMTVKAEGEDTASKREEDLVAFHSPYPHHPHECCESEWA